MGSADAGPLRRYLPNFERIGSVMELVDHLFDIIITQKQFSISKWYLCVVLGTDRTNWGWFCYREMGVILFFRSQA